MSTTVNPWDLEELEVDLSIGLLKQTKSFGLDEIPRNVFLNGHKCPQMKSITSLLRDNWNEKLLFITGEPMIAPIFKEGMTQDDCSQ